MSNKEKIINPEKQKITLVAQGHLFKLKFAQTRVTPIPGVRGDISGFSAQSRKRMLELMARLDVENAGFICFITLTYPDGDGPPSWEETERDRRTILKRLLRLHPESSAIWRREWELRKSGEFREMEFPHYHMIFFGLPFLPANDLNAMWAEVIGCNGYVRTEIKGIESWKQAFFYVSKYLAKPDPFGVGKGVEGPAAPRAAAPQPADDGSLVYVTYLTEDDDKKNKKKTGRVWGVFNRKHLPMGKFYFGQIPYGNWVDTVKEAAWNEWEGITSPPGYGFTLFFDQPERAEAFFNGAHVVADATPPKPDDDIPF